MNSLKLLDKAVEQFASLPGIGRKTALKFVLNLLKREDEEVKAFTESIIDLKKNIRECTVCHNITDGEICDICSNPKRDRTLVCVVENGTNTADAAAKRTTNMKMKCYVKTQLPCSWVDSNFTHFFTDKAKNHGLHVLIKRHRN